MPRTKQKRNRRKYATHDNRQRCALLRLSIKQNRLTFSLSPSQLAFFYYYYLYYDFDLVLIDALNTYANHIYLYMFCLLSIKWFGRVESERTPYGGGVNQGHIFSTCSWISYFFFFVRSASNNGIRDELWVHEPHRSATLRWHGIDVEWKCVIVQQWRKIMKQNAGFN